MSFTDTLLSLFPLAMYIFILSFYFTIDFFQEFPVLGFMLICPVFCLFCTKQIICSVTKMKFNPFQLHGLILCGFYLNRLLPNYVEPMLKK